MTTTTPTLDHPTPLCTFNRLAHVGTLNPADRAATSQEGDGLSVSVNPDDWKHIAHLGGNPTWTLTRSDGQPFQMLDAHALTRTERDAIMRWARHRGWVERQRVWTVPTLDDNGELGGRLACDTPEEAAEELDELLPWVDGSMRKSLRVRAENRWVATQAHPVVRKDWADAWDITLTVWAVSLSGVDGVWWADRYAPCELSCPRGVVPGVDGLVVVAGWQ